MTVAVPDPLAQAIRALAGVFRVPNLRRLEVAYASSLSGLWAYSVVIVVYTFDLGGASLVGVSALVRLIPAAVAAPFAALLADRYPRRAVMLLTDSSRAVLVGAIAVAVAVDLPAMIVLSLAGMVAVVSTAFEPAKNALLPSLVDEPEQLTAANVATSTLESSAIFAGPALGGLVLALASPEAALALTAALLVCSALMLARIEEPEKEAQGEAGDDDGGETEEHLFEEVLGGARAIAGDRRLALLVGLLGSQLLVDGAIGVFVAVIALDLLDIGQGGVGLLDSAAGVGGLVGSLVVLSLVSTRERGLASMFGLGIAAWGVPLVLIAAFPQPAVALAAFALIGIANTVVDACGLTLLQRTAADDVRGRVFGALETIAIAAIGLGSITAAGLLAAFGTQAALIAAGAFLPCLTLLSWRALRLIDVEIPLPGPELELLRGVSIFAGLASAPLEELASRLERIRVAAGSEVIRQGEEGDRFYVIQNGEVEVFEDGVSVRREGPGDFFGEIALIREVPRTATVVALTDVELLALDREPFIAAVSGHARTKEAADAVIASRLGSVRAGAGSV